MPDAPDASPDSSSEGEGDRYIQQWNALCDELGTSDPNEVLARVQTLKRQMERLDAQDRSKEGLVTISEVEEVFREMNEKIETLRERNAALAEELKGTGESGEALSRLHRKNERLLRALGASTTEEAHDRIDQLSERLETLRREKEQLERAGLSDVEEAVEELERLREERDALREELDETDEEGPTPSPDPDTSVLEAAVVIRDRVGISSPGEAEALTQVVREMHDRISSRAEAQGVEVDDAPDTVMDLLQSMASHLNALPAPTALPPSAAEALGVKTASEAQSLADTARRIGRRIAERHEGSIELEAIDPEAEDALSLLHAVEDQLGALPDADAPAAEDALPAEAGDILGIRSVEDAHELEGLIDDMSSRLESLQTEHRKLDDAGLSVEGALTMIENMEAQLVDLYHHSDETANGHASAFDPAALDDALLYRVDTLVDADPERDDLSTVLRSLVDRLETLDAAYAPLAEADLDGEEAITLIESMEAQLNDLYEKDEQSHAAAERLAAIEEVLGISTRREAEDLSALARDMEEQLKVLYEDKQKLRELGLSSIEDAVEMIESMETQLTELYEDKESLRDLELGGTEEQSTFQQLEALYAERQKLQEALGVSAAEDVIEMVETLNSQLDDLYAARDADLSPEERHEAQLWAPEPTQDDASEPAADREAASPDRDETAETDALTLNSMERQLEALYREKEVLLQHGLDSADEAVEQLQTQRRQINALQRENHTYEQRFDRLRSALGTDRVPHIVDLVRALESEADTSLEALRPLSPESSESSGYGVHIEATSPFVDAETLDRLDEMDEEALADLDVGVVRLDDEGTVEALNPAALQLPGLRDVDDPDSVVGKNFFLELAPSTNNNLFFGRFQKGQRQGELDARFPYTFTSPQEESQPFAVHLYRASDGNSNWLLFRPV